ncbi:hypothetical protein CV770_08655 [Bradyrhizobium sp. AC87j1]|nr:hypothetical protein CV770_08655 [Bradyrhizobium sp. AC87j1]
MEEITHASSAPSLRAQRSNPESFRGEILDCFVARAPRNDAARVMLAMMQNGYRARPNSGSGTSSLTPPNHNDTTSTRSASRRRASSPPDNR